MEDRGGENRRKIGGVLCMVDYNIFFDFLFNAFWDLLPSNLWRRGGFFLSKNARGIFALVIIFGVGGRRSTFFGFGVVHGDSCIV